MKYLLAPLFIFTSLFAINAQQGTEIGIMGGVSTYSGDLSKQEFGVYLDEAKPAFGAFARFNLNRTFALRLGATLGQVSGDDKNTGRQGRGLSFRSRISEFSVVGEANLFKIGRSKYRGTIPYLFGGLAVFSFNPEAAFDGDYVELQPLGTEGQGLPNYEAPYRLTQLSIPLGIGLKFMLNRNITLGLEFGGRKTFTDHLDDVSYAEVNYLDVLEGNGELAAMLSNPTLKDNDIQNITYRRGVQSDDWYFFGGVTISFRLNGSGSGRGNGKGIGCPTF